MSSKLLAKGLKQLYECSLSYYFMGREVPRDVIWSKLVEEVGARSRVGLIAL